MNAQKNQVTCRICGTPGGEKFQVREMLFGSRQVFDYFQCPSCGCLQIEKIPDDMSAHYPDDYYSFALKTKKTRPWVSWLRTKRARYAIEKKGIIGKTLYTRKKPDPLICLYGDIGVKLTDSILDVGGGGGAHAKLLRQTGFKDALAIDKFIEQDIYLDGELLTKKADLFEIKGQFDLITFHHSFEHMDGGLKILDRAKKLLAPGGRILIRIPCVSSKAWQHYGVNWMALDAPRHFYLHSHDSMRQLATQASLNVKDLWCDSNMIQFWGSEQYAKDIPLNDARSYNVDPENSIFSKDDIARFQRQTEQVNKELQGDTICVLLETDQPSAMASER